MVNAYYFALKKYSDSQVVEAGYKCLDECEFMPKPVDISKRIMDAERNKPTQYTDGFQDIGRATCIECGKVEPCYQEKGDKGWLCRDCFRGYDEAEYLKRVKALVARMERKSNETQTQQPN